MHDTPSALAAWANFYVMIGSSAAALTGLMFVVITLVADARTQTTDDGIATFSTPTVVHFCAALLMAAILSAPWPGLVGAAIALAAVGAGGIVYVGKVIARTRRQTAYHPGMDDWIWYSVFPLAGYFAVVVSAAFLLHAPRGALFALAGAVLMLMFIGIHNAWDVVTYIAVKVVDPPAGDPPAAIGTSASP